MSVKIYNISTEFGRTEIHQKLANDCKLLSKYFDELGKHFSESNIKGNLELFKKIDSVMNKTRKCKGYNKVLECDDILYLNMYEHIYDIHKEKIWDLKDKREEKLNKE